MASSIERVTTARRELGNDAIRSKRTGVHHRPTYDQGSAATRQNARLEIRSGGKPSMGFKSEYFTYETQFTKGKLPKLLVQSITHVCASKRMEPDLINSTDVTHLLQKKA